MSLGKFLDFSGLSFYIIIHMGNNVLLPPRLNIEIK